MNRKKRIVLTIGFAVIAASFIAITVWKIVLMNHTTNLIDQKYGFLLFIFLIYPMLLEELILLRGVYQLVNTKPKGAAKIFTILSAIMVTTAIIFQLLSYTGHLQNISLKNMIVLSEWPVMILSFVLMGIGRWQNEKSQAEKQIKAIFNRSL